MTGFKRKVMRNVLTTAVAGVLGIAGTVGLGGSAHAAGSWVQVMTTDDRPGGLAQFAGFSAPEYLMVCDRQGDNWAAFGKLWVRSGGKWVQRKALRDGSHDGKCKRSNINVREGRKVKVKVCLMRGSGSNKVYRHCNQKTGRA
ncbi:MULTISPECIES: hypothetical protein [Streptomyces]|uniref:Uncharacterized protein n=1 Tax=Streptomyces cacaoi TaxID=1898 RepID=A0A4Y3QUS9_STRCI|nr:MULTISPECIES: hypothetical protein [Streptomyces]NNG83710.1 hypothetical protein [Streptomyces cacaoi]GEB49154.1 hypothetical protein SCA03_17050 [Streptomyces cacaoi]